MVSQPKAEKFSRTIKKKPYDFFPRFLILHLLNQMKLTNCVILPLSVKPANSFSTYHILRYSCISTLKLHLANKYKWPSHWHVLTEAKFPLLSIELSVCHEHILVSLLTYLSIFLPLYMIVTFDSFRTDTATFKYSFIEEVVIFFAFHSGAAYEANRPWVGQFLLCCFSYLCSCQKGN